VQRSIDLVIAVAFARKENREKTNETGVDPKGSRAGIKWADYSRCMPANATRPSHSSCQGVLRSTSSSSEE
jgi:hypothetical protein